MLPPTNLLQGRYHLDACIGQGGMGAVYRAVDRQSGQVVAIKHVRGGATLALAAAREARLLARLRHPALPAVRDAFADATGQYLVMRFVPGTDLADRLTRRATPFPVATVLAWADQLLELLHFLHTRRSPVVHRDIKPRNLKLADHDRIVLLDFGLAKGLGGAEAASLAGYTLAYAPPEQVRGIGTEPRSDLYALGSTLYELLTRQRPPDALQRLAAVAAGQPDPLRSANEANPAIPPPVATVIGQALALVAAHRPATARALREALREAASGPVTVLAPVAAAVGVEPTRRPTGTVTFLTTELGGTTTPAPTTAAALACHDSWLRQAMDTHRGFVFRATDAGLTAAFATADAALAAALAAMRALSTLPGEAVGTPAARMALHTGRAEFADDEYVGTVLPRLSRLLATGHVGQILLARATQELIADQLPPGVSLLDLGDHRLPDLSKPERVYQVAAADLPADFPPLASREVRSPGLPAPATPLVGRSGELTRLVDRLRQPPVRLVTLIGPGGVGKTRLALATAETVLDDFADGVYFVPLAAVRDPGLFLQAIAQALGAQERPGQSPRDGLRAALRDRQMLLVLDNCEQVPEAGALVADLLADAPGLAVMATSRALLGLDGEEAFSVPPLAFPTPDRRLSPTELARYPAVELFVQQARAMRADLALTDETAAPIAGICARLDGLPLAIELAAARADLFTPALLLARLERHLPLPAAGRPLGPARHQTLRATLAWSFDLLPPNERCLFARLGAFVGGCDLEAAEEVCGAPDDAGMGLVAGLAALVAASLLRPVETPGGVARYEMLETVREYAAERLAATDDGPAIRQRHADHFLALAETADAALGGPTGGAWLARLARENDNLRASLGWLSAQRATEPGLRLAAALWRPWQVHGQLCEGRGWLDRLLAASVGQETKARARALVGAGALAWRQQDTAAARLRLDEAALACRAADEPAGLATALKHLALIALYGQPPAPADANRLLEESLALRRGLHDQDGVASCLNDLAMVALGQGELERANRLLAESLALCRALDNRYGLGFVLHNLSLIALRQRQPDRAAALLREGLLLAQALESDERVGCALWGLACVAALRGRATLAAALYGGAVCLNEATGVAFSPSELATLEETIAAARATVSPAAWEAAVVAGRDRPTADLVAEALAAAA